MKRKKVSLKATSLVVLASTLSTASIISIAAATSSSLNNANQGTEGNSLTSDLIAEQAAKVSNTQKTAISTSGVLAKITDYNVSREKDVKTFDTLLNRRYGSKGFKYPGVNHTYELGINKFLYVDGRVVDMAQEVLNEKAPYAQSQKYNDPSFLSQYLAVGKNYKHPAADGLYVNKISSVKAVTKQFNVNTRVKGSLSLGLFAAPGEPFTLKFDNKTFEALKRENFKGLEITINDNNFEDYNNSVSTKITTRYPYTKTTYQIDPYTQTAKFYSPFGGMISLNIKQSLFDQYPDIKEYDSSWINFEVSGALETLEYIHGVTSEAGWMKQLEKVKSGSIYQSAVSLVSEFGSIIIPSTGVNEFGGVNINDMLYPQKVIQKWTDLGFLGSYLSKRDYSGVNSRVSYNFSNESYWGGGFRAKDKTSLYAPTELGGQSFLKGLDGFTSIDSQKLFNALGFDYKQTNVLFRGSDAEKANQAIIPILTTLLDTSRGRNAVGVYGDANSLQNSYQTVQKIRNRQGSDQTSIYTLLLYTVGPERYMDYMRWALSNSLNTSPYWTPMKEVEAMSNFFGINLYQAFSNTNATWSGGWPRSYREASKEEKQIIDRLTSKYQAVDFVSNLYASGTYYLSNGNLTYSGDYAAPFEIPAGEDYTFDFGKFIKSTSNSFNWSKLSVSAKSSKGVRLEIDPKDSRKVIYKGSTLFAPDDEFIVTIYPNFVNNKLSNYTPSYSWSIKLRSVTNSTLVSTYESNATYDAATYLSKIKSGSKDVKLVNESYDIYKDKDKYFETNKKTAVRYRFKFVAPETGRYFFSNRYDDSIIIFANGREIYRDNNYTLTYKDTAAASLIKGQDIDFDILVSNIDGAGGFGMNVKYGSSYSAGLNSIVNKNIDMWSNVVVQNINKVKELAHVWSPLEFITNQKYIYKPKTTNYFSYSDSLAIYKIGSNEFDYSVINTNAYTLKPVKNVSQQLINRLNDQSTNFEVWGHRFVEFDLEFKNPTNVSSLVFSHRMDNHYNSRPTYIRIDGTTTNGNKVNLYKGSYGGQFDDRGNPWSGLNFSGNQKYNKISVLIQNDYTNSIVLRKLYVSDSKYYPADSWSTHKEVIFKNK